MRNDAIGLFWEDLPPVKKAKKEKQKRTPPERVWERADYLPGLEEAYAFDVPRMTEQDLFNACVAHEPLVWDIECFRNFFQIAFMSTVTGKVIDFMQVDGWPLQTSMVSWILQNFQIVGFNSRNYDAPMAALALSGKSCSELKDASDMLIGGDMQPWQVLRTLKVKQLTGIDHIDLGEVAPGVFTSLKKYAARMHAPRMQDLPVHHATVLSGAQMAIVRWYCVNDLRNTKQLREVLKDELALREQMSNELGEDLRSKSDAQIAEAVIAKDIHRLTGQRPKVPTIEVGTRYKYNAPSFLKFQSPTMQWALDLVNSLDFVVAPNGRVGLPPELADLKIPIGKGRYTLRIGGLHSTEKKVKHLATENIVLRDWDVESFYPRVMLNLGLFPPHIGPAFLKVFEAIVDRRIAAKRAGDKKTADSLKITINGTYGKLGNLHSIFYAPDLVIQVTLTGQLSLLMLIERLELAGIEVVSANTDGIVVKMRKNQQELGAAIVKQWEIDTQYKTEETKYSAVYSKDVNNYIALKEGGGAPKLKGVFGNPWTYGKSQIDLLRKNPVTTICIEAVVEFIVNKVPIAETIMTSTDFTKFVAIREADGGATAGGIYYGKTIRWYYSTETGLPEIVDAGSGNKVGTSEGGKPCMDLPPVFPDDLDREKYIKNAEKILNSIGYNNEEPAVQM